MSAHLLHQFLVNPIEERADSMAIDSRYGGINYGQLQNRVSRLSHWLIKNGCARQDRVAVCLPKRIASVECILATMYAGAIYVPVDYTAPAERIFKIVTDAAAQRIITLPNIRKALIDIGLDPGSISAIDNINELEATDQFIKNFEPVDTVEVGDDDLAALLYTSGSTGEPKGVMLSHKNIATFAKWVVEKFNITSDDKLSSHAPFLFDLSTMDLYSTFFAGASVYVFDEVEKRFPSTLGKVIQDKKITSWYSVPSALMLLEEKGAMHRRDFSSLRQIFFAGEVYPLPALRKLMKRLPGVEFVNLYGPTETNVCTYYILPAIPAETETSIPIGKACEHYTLTILNDENKVAADGEMGEICIEGPGVMKGYWGDHEKTAASRVNDAEDSYRTGDFGLLQDDGTVLFLGRKDSQVKIHGYRIELNEIEEVANTHPLVKESVAVVVEHDNLTKIYLCVARSGDEAVEKADLIAICASKLPVYAVPSEVLVMDEFERTTTGKIDRQYIKNSIADSALYGSLVATSP